MNPYEGADAFPVSVDVPDDSDPPASATFNVATEGLADRTVALSNGYRNLLADLNALAAVDTTSLADGTLRTVTGFGLYELDKTLYPTFAEDRPLVVAPTTGTGRWFAQSVDAKRQYVKTFTTVGANFWTCPPNLAQASVEVIGGGGGGGGGANASGTSADAPGGGGGARGGRFAEIISPVANAQHDLTVGDGGAGGTGGTSDGSDGASSVIQVHLGATLATALGGQGATRGGDATVGSIVLVPGGRAGLASIAHQPVLKSTDWLGYSQHEGDGGCSANEAAGTDSGGAWPGAPTNGFAGGNAGARGTDNTNKGGGGGGGGGAGFYGSGSDGGAGGNGDTGSSNTNGANATAVTVTNGGAGGGGGGGAGAGTAGRSGGNGAKGDPGRVTIRGFS